MSQLKNGTLLVIAATVITSVLILMTNRDQSKPDQTIEITKNKIPTVKTSSEEIEAIESKEALTVKKDEEQDEIINVVQSDPVLPPKGPFNKDVTESDAVTEPSTLVSQSSQHEILNHIVQPIWMDQKLGDFKSVEKGEVVFKIMPTNQEGLQGENPKQVVTNKDDKFVPTVMPANYNYQQMPMYNGGYYIAPMPSYLMSSMLPGNASIGKN